MSSNLPGDFNFYRKKLFIIEVYVLTFPNARDNLNFQMWYTKDANLILFWKKIHALMKRIMTKGDEKQRRGKFNLKSLEEKKKLSTANLNILDFLEVT